MLSKRLKLALVSMVLVSVLAGTVIALQFSPTERPSNQESGQQFEEPHFSVRWMGFFPIDYNDSYPDYYICINNLKDPIKMQIALQIKNQEDSGFYFRVDQFGTPPSGWSILPMEVGFIDVLQTVQFIYDNSTRSRPTSIPEGRRTESINLMVQAYYDSDYLSLYSQDDFIVTFHLVDLTSTIWTTLYHEGFDDGTIHGWSAIGDHGYLEISGQYYRSFPYSLSRWATCAAPGGIAKDFTISGSYEEAYLIFSMKGWPDPEWCPPERPWPYLALDGVQYFKSDVLPPNDIWYQFTVPLPTNKTTSIEIWGDEGHYNFDNIYVIAK